MYLRQADTSLKIVWSYTLFVQFIFNINDKPFDLSFVQVTQNDNTCRIFAPFCFHNTARAVWHGFKKPRFCRFFKKPKNLKSPNLGFLGLKKIKT